MKGELEKKEAVPVPIGGFVESRDVNEVNQLVASREYVAEQVTTYGKYILKRLR